MSGDGGYDDDDGKETWENVGVGGFVGVWRNCGAMRVYRTMRTRISV